MLDIIVPHYNEAWEIGEKLFRMMDLQRGVDFNDFRVFLIHDGTAPFPEETFSGFKYKVDQVTIPHGGVSAARNAGMDSATADWIMFCDFDDMFSGVYALRDILTVLPKAEEFDVLWMQTLTEDLVEGGTGEVYFTPEKKNWVFTHGKLYRRQYLIGNDLRFNEEMAFQEDSEFNGRIIARLDFHRIGKIATKTAPYIWIRRPSSVTQSGRDDEATFGHFRRNLIITEEYRRHRGPEEYAGMVTRTAWDTYCMIMGRRATIGMKVKILAAFVPWIRERYDCFMQVEPDILQQIRIMAKSDLLDPDEKISDSPGNVRAWVDELIARSDFDGNIHDEPGAD